MGVMKGVILGICPQARLVDLDHRLPAGNIRAGALVLEQALPHFPPHTIHLAVIDPGVGTARRPICLATGQGILVGPDNGLFSLAMQTHPQARAYEICNPHILPARRSHTFHGRDVFAPAAAHLACGLEPSQLGPMVQRPVELEWPQPREENGILHGRVIWADRFGNLASNISRARLGAFLKGRPCKVRIQDKLIENISLTFAQSPPGEALALINSWDRLELALNQASLAQRLGLSPENAFGLNIQVMPFDQPR